MMKVSEDIRLWDYEGPCGGMLLGDLDGEIVMCDWATDERLEFTCRRIYRHISAQYQKVLTPTLIEASRQLDEYFAGERYIFELPVRLIGSDFQKLIWESLSGIAYGEQSSYQEISNQRGRPESVRAVANAIGANPLSIIIPCHRVIGSDGSLRGYAGGVEAKRWLLKHEKNVAAQ